MQPNYRALSIDMTREVVVFGKEDGLASVSPRVVYVTQLHDRAPPSSMSLSSWSPQAGQQVGDADQEKLALLRMLDAAFERFPLYTPDSNPFGSRSQSILGERCGDIEDGWSIIKHAYDSIPLPSSELSPVVLRAEPLSNFSQFGVGASGSTRTPRSSPTSLRLGIWIPASEKIPQELFDNILSYVASRSSGSKYSWAIPRAAKSSSLVCRYWATRCRAYMFSGAILDVNSPEKAEMLVQYALYGCPSLIPLHTLISEIDVSQTYEMPYSFLHHISRLMSLNPKFRMLHLDGPVPNGFPSCKLDTPHWSIPSSIPTPPSLLSYESVYLKRIHLPSFTHAAKYISHFQSATSMQIKGLTWDDDGADPSTQAIDVARVRRGNFYKMRNEESRLAFLRCTDTARLLTQALIANIRSPLYAISDDPPANDRVAMLDILQEICPSVLKINNCAKIGITYYQKSLAREKLMAQINIGINDWKLTFILEDCGSKSPPIPDLHVVGCSILWDAYTHGISALDPIIDELMPHLHRFPMLHAIAMIFCWYEQLLETMSRYRPLPFHLLISSHKYIIAFFRSNKGNEKPDFSEVVPLDPKGKQDYIGINPITLLPTGQVWKDTEDIIPSLLAIPGP